MRLPTCYAHFPPKTLDFKLSNFPRNFGQQAAITAGLSQVDADAVILLDGDLQDPPELIPEMVEAWKNGGQVVLARRRSRQETGIRRLGFEAFHRVFKHLIDVHVPPNTGTYSLLDREALNALRNLPEAHRFFPGLRAWIGFDQVFVEYDRHDRYLGTPKQTIKRLFRYASDGILSFSFKPLRLMTVSGFAICTISLLVALAFVVKRMIGTRDGSRRIHDPVLRRFHSGWIATDRDGDSRRIHRQNLRRVKTASPLCCQKTIHTRNPQPRKR